MKVLIGTTNPSKVGRFKNFLQGCDIEFYTLNDLGIREEPSETGSTPIENAIIKANFYGQFFDTVICNDSGLYFDCLAMDDSRQPGLNVRTPGGRPRMNDEELLAYYLELVRSLGGKALAYYLDGIAVFRKGTVYSFMEDRDTARQSAFYMIDQPAGRWHPGWPLDSISINRTTNAYFVDAGNQRYDSVEENVIVGASRSHVVQFLKNALGYSSAI